MEEGGSSDEADTITHTAIEQLLTQFETLFQVPTTLPSHRNIDHHIHLYPNTKPVIVYPYHYSHYQKGEMEKLVNEMVSQGIILNVKDRFPSPTADEMFDELGGDVVFTKLD
ncbi:hypothetical protein Tco_1582115 [Tanacetum coccineum]